MYLCSWTSLNHTVEVLCSWWEGSSSTNRARSISNSTFARSIDIASVRRAPHRIGFGTGCSERTSDDHREL